MSMIGTLLRLDNKELELILEDSSLLEEKIDAAYENEDPMLIDLDKAWEAILFLLTGYGLAKMENASPPLSWVLYAGYVVDEDQDLGYGPGYYLTPDQVKEIDSALQQVSDDDMRTRFDGPKMMKEGIYPEMWDDPSTIDYILEYFQSLKTFYKEAAQQSQAVVTFLS